MHLRFTALLFVLTTLFSLLSSPAAQAQSRLEKVLSDQLSITSEGFWLYNDLNAGMEAAKKNGKPIIVTFRCIPCEHCVKLDEQLVEADPEVQRLLSRYVRVRQVSTNGLDLQQFPFDYDQSSNVMLLNADGTIYGRYGTRSHQTEWESDISVRGLAEALRKGLELHKNYPANRDQLAGKQGSEVLFETPNKSPLHQSKFPEKLEFNDQVVKNCIHCHMVGDAQRDYFVRQGKTIPDQYLFQFPHPKALGLIIDPQTAGTVQEVQADSLAAQAGFLPGDEIVAIETQPILSIADMQWAFQQAKAGDQVAFQIQRAQKDQTLSMTLPEGWRQLDDISWRVTSWPLRRMVFGGMVLKPLGDEQRQQLEIGDYQMALEVTHVGKYGLHATALRAGIKQGDVVVQMGSREDLMRETDALAYGIRNYHKGDEIPFVVLQNGKKKKFSLPFQP